MLFYTSSIIPLFKINFTAIIELLGNYDWLAKCDLQIPEKIGQEKRRKQGKEFLKIELPWLQDKIFFLTVQKCL